MLHSYFIATLYDNFQKSYSQKQFELLTHSDPDLGSKVTQNVIDCSLNCVQALRKISYRFDQ